MKILGIIPSRYGSTRFPAKALVDIKGKTMIQRVYEQASKAELLSMVVVATDHQKIYDHVLSFGGNACMTSPDHVSGTDRCYEALQQQEGNFDYVINIQGDEPFIAPSQIDSLGQCLDGQVKIGTLIKPINSYETLNNPNVVKVIIDKKQDAIYFSRNALPFIRGIEKKKWLEHHTYYKHIGIYAYRSDTLSTITALKRSSLEIVESLEQLRWVENGYSIRTVLTDLESVGIDTPEDLEAVIKNLDQG